MKSNIRYLVLLLPIVLMTAYIVSYAYLYSMATTLSCALIVLWYTSKNNDIRNGIWIIGAFAFSIGGDRMLKLCSGHDLYFVSGISLFFIAHVLYLTYSLRNGRMAYKFLTVMGCGFLIYYCTTLMPRIPDVTVNIFVCLYILISCISLAAAKGLKIDVFSRNLFFGGIASLAFSDTLISIESFIGHTDVYFLMLPTYYASQILVTAAYIHLCTLPQKVKSDMMAPDSNLQK